MAEGIAINVATKVAEASVNQAIKEVHYLCCFQSYVDDFDERRARLKAKVENVNLDIKEASNRNANDVDPVVQNWLNEANALIQEDTKKKHERFFGLFSNWVKKNRRAKDLEGKAQKVEDLLNKGSFAQVARLTGSPGLKFHYSQDFIHFESRKLKHEELKEALKSEENCMIGLVGMGGAGKTTMAIQVGREVEESKVFDKVIFTSASNSNKPANVVSIRNDIARKLGLQLPEGNDSRYAEELWTRISNNEGKLLIILDDVWDKELSLQAIGIPLGHQQKGHCVVLLTTRNLGVCSLMRCHKTIQLESLSPNDALNLFLFHSGKSSEDSSSNFQNVALEIVEECGRLPIAIVPVARALNSKSLESWKATLTRLQTFDPMSEDEDEGLTKAYKSLRLSFDNLNNHKSLNLLFLCSLFPEDYEIPAELLRRISIGLGLCGDVRKYDIARSQVLEVEDNLVESFLLLKDKEEHVKLHDLVRDMAIRLANTKIEVVIDSNTTLKGDTQYSSWNIGSFPANFGGSKLEFLLIWINAQERHVKIPESLFATMKELKVLVLNSRRIYGLIQLSLPKSIESLRNIRTLILFAWSLGDMSIVGNLVCLETLELTECYLNELPSEISELHRLTLLGLKRCTILSKDPIKVIERCQKLEELYFVYNSFFPFGENTDEHDGLQVPHALQRYNIVGYSVPKILVSQSRLFPAKCDFDLISLRCFKAARYLKVFSKPTFKYLVANAEILELGRFNSTGWRNVIPDIVGMEDGGMKDLIRLYLFSWPEIEFLIHTEHLQPGVTIFSKLLKLKLSDMDVKELCYGPLPNDFLKQLLTLKLEGCLKLEGTLFKDELDLGQLKSIKVRKCSVTSLFHPSTAQSLKQLESLEANDCNQLKYIVMGEGSKEDKIDDDPYPNQRSHGSMIQDKRGAFEMGEEIILPSLKKIIISRVPSFINIFPENYYPGASILENSPPTTRNGLQKKDPSPTSTFSWASICCFQPKSSASTTSNPIASDSSKASKKEWIFDTIQCLLRQPLNPINMKEMKITHCSKLTSLFTLTIASSMVSLEKLEINECPELKHIVIDDKGYHGHDLSNCNSIFPNLEEVSVHNCFSLEVLFPASHFRTLDRLKSLSISSSQNLRHVFGKCYCEDDWPTHHNQNVEIHLSILKVLKIEDAPKLVSICAENCHLSTILSLETFVFGECPQLAMRPFSGSVVCCNEIEDLTVTKPDKLLSLSLTNVKIETIYNLIGPMKSSLQVMRLVNMIELRHICCVGTKNVLRLQNLSHVMIQGCNKLKVIFSVSILRSLSQLGKLVISECQELVEIVEETNELNPGLMNNKKCFPMLSEIEIRGCKNLQCLFSISTCGALPKLENLTIEDVPKLVQVFGISKQGDETKEWVFKDLFPQLSTLQLVNLPSLVSVCQGIHLQMDPLYIVRHCPKLSITCSTTTAESDNQDFEQLELEYNENPISDSNPQLQAPSSESEMMMPLSKSEAHIEVTKPIVEEELEIPEQKNSSSNLQIQEIMMARVQDDGSKITNATTANQTMDSKDALVDEGSKKESTMTGQQATTETTHDMNSSDSQNSIEMHVRKVSSLNEDNEPTTSTHSPHGIIHLGPSTSTKNLKEVTKSFVEEESANQEQNNSPLNLDTLVDKEAENEPITKGQQGANSTPPDTHSNESQNNIEVRIGEGRSIEQGNKIVSSTHSETEITRPSSSTSTKELQVKKLMNDREALEGDTTTKEVVGRVEKPLMNDAQKGEIKDPKDKGDHKVSQQVEKDRDLIRLFQLAEKGAETGGVHTHFVSKIVADGEDDTNKVAKAFTDLEASLKMNLNVITNSEENCLRLQNALNFLSTNCFEDGANSFHSLKPKLDSLQQKFQTFVSSFKQASATIHTFTDLVAKEKFMMSEELPQRKKEAVTLISEIDYTERSLGAAKQNEAKLKEQMSRLEIEMNNNEKEIKECEIKLLSLKEQESKSLWESLKFVKELEDVKNNKSEIEEDQIKARHELEKLDTEWSSYVANVRKTTSILEFYLKFKI